MQDLYLRQDIVDDEFVHLYQRYGPRTTSHYITTMHVDAIFDIFGHNISDQLAAHSGCQVEVKALLKGEI